MVVALLEVVEQYPVLLTLYTEVEDELEVERYGTVVQALTASLLNLARVLEQDYFVADLGESSFCIVIQEPYVLALWRRRVPFTIDFLRSCLQKYLELYRTQVLGPEHLSLLEYLDGDFPLEILDYVEYVVDVPEEARNCLDEYLYTSLYDLVPRSRVVKYLRILRELPQPLPELLRRSSEREFTELLLQLLQRGVLITRRPEH